MMDNDAQILNTYRQGRYQTSMKLVMSVYGDDIYRFIHAMLRNEDDAADVTQEVFIKIFKQLNSYRKEAPLRSWIFRIAKNSTLSYLASTGYKVASQDLDPLEQEDELSPDKVNLRPYLQKLDQDLSVPLTMYYFMNCSYEEISQILDLPLNTLKARIRRAKLALYQHLKAEGISYEAL